MGVDKAAGAELPRIDGYTLEALIDTGGFSRVYRATQHGLDRSVAVKVLNASFEDERQQRTFERECKVMGQLSTHQNIVTVFASALTVDRHPCIIMELYDTTFRAEERLEIAEVIDVGAKVADALQAIHDRGIVHRDIKPHNIFISAHGEPAIGDFGISSIASERTVTGAAGFSINYAPPEVFEDGGAGASGDIYALGATLYQLAAGEVPFPHTGDPADRMKATVHKIITAPPPSLRRSDSPDALNQLLRRCMAKNPVDRPATPSDVANELRRLQQQVGLPTKRTNARAVSQPQPSDRSPVQTIDRGAAFTDNVTALRDRKELQSSALKGGTRDVDREQTRTARKYLMVGAGALLIAVSAVAIAAGFSGGGSETPATTIAPTAASGSDFTVLSPPNELSVERLSFGSYQITWSASQTDVKYQIHLVGSSDNRFVDKQSFLWTLTDDPGTACFEVRTVNAEQTRVSQSAAGPACASG